MDQASHLASFDSLLAENLPLNAEMAIHVLFDSLEGRFGRIFVSHAFTYLTICEGGMSEREMEDVLSLDDEVLNEAYEYHDPPLRNMIRVPPLMWARLAFEVQQYLTEHEVDGVTTVTWYHMLFQKYAIDKYHKQQEAVNTKKKCFEYLKELFTHEGDTCFTFCSASLFLLSFKIY